MFISLTIVLSILIFTSITLALKEKAFIGNSRENQFLNSHRSNNGQNKFYGFWIIKGDNK